MSTYFLKENCPNCKAKLDIGFKFCPSCGALVSNDGPRVIRTSTYNINFYNKDKEVSLVKKTYNSIVSNISENLNSSDNLANEKIHPLLINILDDVNIIDYNKDLVLDENCGFFHDYKGYYFINDRNHRASINKKSTDPFKKYYLINNDYVEFDDDIFIYTILDQKDVAWNKISLKDDINNIISLIRKENESLYLKYDPNFEIRLNNADIRSDMILSDKDLVSINSRKFLLKDSFLYFQNELKDYQKKSKAIFANSIREDDFLRVDIKEKKVSSKNGPKTLLKDIKFKVKPKELVLILGSSGAGKSTLFKEFLNEDNPYSHISLGDVNFSQNFNLVKRMVSTVPQFNLNRDYDTVFMTLKNAGELKLPSDFSKDSKLLDSYVMEILEMMNLVKIKDSLVKDLSGGEKKRLSIACEYISSPVMFLLDEPDSGLDGYNARAIMNNLRDIANNNKIIMVITHTPDRSLDLFDKVLVLGKSQKDNCGKLAFFGSPRDAMEFFDTENLETIIDKLLEDSDKYIEKFKKD